MDFKDYYATLGVPHTATHAEIRKAYRRLARRYHPDVSKAPDAEARFKDVAEAHEALTDPERRAAYDELVLRRAQRSAAEPFTQHDAREARRAHPGRRSAHDSDPAFSDFFEAVFGRGGLGAGELRPGPPAPAPGLDQHAKIVVDLLDAWRGARRTITLRIPRDDGRGPPVAEDRRIEVSIPRGIREGQRLRLAGQGAAGDGGEPAGDLYLEVGIAPHPDFRVDGRDVTVELLLAPWEAALGATVPVATPDGSVDLNVPAATRQGRRLRLKGRGWPGASPGDLYAEVRIALPPAADAAGQAAYRALALAFPGFAPRGAGAATEAHAA